MVAGAVSDGSKTSIEEIMSGTLRIVNQDVELATWEPSFDGAPRLFRPTLAQIDGFINEYIVAK